MRIILFTFIFAFLVFYPGGKLYAGSPDVVGNSIINLNDTDAPDDEISTTLVYFFDLRERETFIQFTYFDGQETGISAVAHVQIFNVGNLCNENNFFDTYTINDTHVYNMRDIQTNNGNPSGVVLPEDAYGIVVITAVAPLGIDDDGADPIGNFRILDNNGYEYRTNAQTFIDSLSSDGGQFPSEVFHSFNFNTQAGVTLSDVVGITLYIVNLDDDLFTPGFEYAALPVQGIFSPFDIDIYDLNEVPFSCRDIIFSCVNEDNPLIEEVLEVAGTANVAAFEYGINNALPHSKGGELLCPGNIISDGLVVLRPENYPNTEQFASLIEPFNSGPFFYGYVGLNNGNGRGSMDSFWTVNFCNLDNCPLGGD